MEEDDLMWWPLKEAEDVQVELDMKKEMLRKV